jgi:hypothetical protein
MSDVPETRRRTNIVAARTSAYVFIVSPIWLWPSIFITVRGEALGDVAGSNAGSGRSAGR